MSEQFLNKPLEDEISLREIINFLLESWKLITISALIGGLLATVYAYVAPPKYQAFANIQVAKVAGIEVESPAVLIEKLKSPTYYSTKSYSGCDVIDGVDPGKEIVSNLKPSMAKSVSIISLSYTKNSPEDARKCLEAVLHDIRSNQSLLAKPILELKKKQLINLKKKLDASEKIVKALPIKNRSFDFSDAKFSSSALLLATLLNEENEIKNLHAQIYDLEVALMEPQTGETSLATPIYAPQQKVSPKRILILTGGVVAGLFLGLFFMVGKRRWLAYKALN